LLFLRSPNVCAVVPHPPEFSAAVVLKRPNETGFSAADLGVDSLARQILFHGNNFDTFELLS